MQPHQIFIYSAPSKWVCFLIPYSHIRVKQIQVAPPPPWETFHRELLSDHTAVILEEIPLMICDDSRSSKLQQKC